MTSPLAKHSHRVCAGGRTRHLMRFVDHKDIPEHRRCGIEDFRLLHEIKRRDGHVLNRPWVDAWRQTCSDRAEGIGLEDRCAHAESPRKLIDPLLPHRRRSQHERAVAPSPVLELSEDQGRLNRLAEPDFVSNQDAVGETAENRNGWLELERKDIDVCKSRSAKLAQGTTTRQTPAKRLHPFVGGSPAKTMVKFVRTWTVKWMEKFAVPRRQLRFEICEMQKRAAVVRDGFLDKPAVSAYFDDIPCSECGGRHCVEHGKTRARERPPSA